jgi:hypothetical protein
MTLIDECDCHFSVRIKSRIIPMPKTNKLQAISLCSRSKSTWLLVTSYYESEDENRDISIGSYYPIRLDKAPFLLLPQEIYDEGTRDGKSPKYLYLYHLPTMCRDNEKRLEKISDGTHI